jgi:hypothetical protein
VCKDSATRRERITAILTEISGDSIETSGSPQNNALLFVLEEEDDGRVCPNDPDCGESRVINRYEMALLYFSTNGDGWTNCSADTSTQCVTQGLSGDDGFSPCLEGSSARWLSSDSECDWCGLSCSNIENLLPETDGCRTTDIQLGKSHSCLACTLQ